MRILFGVQGTGNGHLTRARQLIKALCAKGIEVDVLLSGRGLNQWPDEPWLHDARRCRGLTFVTRDGRVDRWRTLCSLRPLRTLSEVGSVCPDHYDLIVTDYEPLCAWASSTADFKESLLHADRVVCSTGFMLISEALHLGLPVLTKPVQGQYEQRANASALLALDIGTVCETPLGDSELSAFLTAPDQVSPFGFRML